ncbi:hypothetical protein [Galbibacter sp. BG1]
MTNKISIRTKVINGRFKRNRNRIIQTIHSLENKEIEISFRRVRKEKSNNQLGYFFKVIIPILIDCIYKEWGEVYDVESAKNLLCKLFNYDEKINKETGEVIKVPRRMRDNTTTQQEELHSESRNFIKEWFNAEIPLPNEEIELEFNK